MKKDVLLIRPFRPGYTSKFISTQEPISLCYLSAYLIKSGLTVNILDLENETFNNADFKLKLLDLSPSVVGFTCYTPTIISAGKLAKLVKKVLPETVTVVGGPHSTALPTETLKEFKDFDIVVIGEGEITLSNIANCVIEGNGYKQLDGLAYRHNGEIVENPPQPLIENLDSLPNPDRNLLNRELYKNVQPTRGFSTNNKRITSVFTSRGCPGKCIFCAARVCFPGGVRFRSADSVLSEVEECIHDHNIGHFVIQDDTFNLKPKRLSAILDGFKKLEVDSWSCDARVDLVNEEMLSEMVDAGCKKISFGVESGSPKIQKLNQKGITVDKVKNAVKWSKKAGLECVETNFIIGSHPDETIDDLKMTEKLIKELNPDILFMSVIVPYPGTKIYEIMRERNLIYSMNWEDFVMIGSIPKWRTQYFSETELMDFQKKILRNYYLRPSFILNKIKNIRNISDLRYWFGAGLDFVNYNIRTFIKNN